MRRRFLCAGLTTFALVLTGCGGDDQQEAEKRAVAWAERVCATVADGGKQLSKPPRLNPSSPRSAKDSVVKYLGLLDGALAAMEAELRKAGSPPVRDGVSAYVKALQTVDEIQGAVGKAVTGLRKAKVSDKPALRKALNNAGKEMAKVRQIEGPAADLKANPALYAVFAKAPTCRRVDQLSSSE